MPGLRAVLVADPVVCRDRLIAFRSGLYRCFGKRMDALFDLGAALLRGPTATGLTREFVPEAGHATRPRKACFSWVWSADRLKGPGNVAPRAPRQGPSDNRSPGRRPCRRPLRRAAPYSFAASREL